GGGGGGGGGGGAAAGGGGGGGAGGGGGRGGGGGDIGLRGRGGGGDGRPAAILASAFEEHLDVAPDDPAAGPGTPHPGQVDVRRLGQLPRQRADLQPPAARTFILRVVGLRSLAPAAVLR